MKHEPLSSIIQGGGKRRMGIGYGSEQTMNMVYNEFPKCIVRGNWWGQPSSGNRAFDDYRAETLRRLEDEQREFKEFLKRLRVARDRAEFDQFMNDRHLDPPSASRGAI